MSTKSALASSLLATAQQKVASGTTTLKKKAQGARNYAKKNPNFMLMGTMFLIVTIGCTIAQSYTDSSSGPILNIPGMAQDDVGKGGKWYKNTWNGIYLTIVLAIITVIAANIPWYALASFTV